MSYQWTSASTPQGRERLKELVDSLNGPEFIIVALSYKQGERFLQNIFKERAFADKSDIDRFFDNPIPIKEFLDPSPTQPKDDPLADDRALVASAFIEDDFEKELLKNAWSEHLVAAIKRLAGMEGKRK